MRLGIAGTISLGTVQVFQGTSGTCVLAQSRGGLWRIKRVLLMVVRRLAARHVDWVSTTSARSGSVAPDRPRKLPHRAWASQPAPMLLVILKCCNGKCRGMAGGASMSSMQLGYSSALRATPRASQGEQTSKCRAAFAQCGCATSRIKASGWRRCCAMRNELHQRTPGQIIPGQPGEA